MKNFITWLYLRYVLTPMFEESEQVIYTIDSGPFERVGASTEAERTMYEREVTSRTHRTDH